MKSLENSANIENSLFKKRKKNFLSILRIYEYFCEIIGLYFTVSRLKKLCSESHI